MRLTIAVLILVCLYALSDTTTRAEQVQSIAVISASVHSPPVVETGYVDSTVLIKTDIASTRDIWLQNFRPKVIPQNNKAVRLHNKDEPFVAIGFGWLNLKPEHRDLVARE